MIIRETKSMTQTERMESRNSNFLYQDKDLKEHISQNKATPHIIESGKSGIWTYRKWSNGTAECWGAAWVDVPSISNATGGVYHSNVLSMPNFPAGLFISDPIVNMAASDNWCWLNCISATTDKCSFKVMRGSQTTSQFGIYPQCEATGRWTEEISPDDYDDIPIVDQTYNPDSENAQSGTAVAEAVENVKIYSENTFADAIILSAGTGKALSVSDSSSGNVRGLNVYGESSQEGTPSPDNPVDIVSVENPVVEVAGKNLFDKNSMIVTGAYVNASGQYKTSTSTEKTAVIPISQNSDITFSKGKISIFRAGLSKEYPEADTQLSSFANISAATKYSASTGDNNYLVVFFYNNSGETANYEDVINSMQLELGSTATAYEPYKEPQSVTIPYTLRGVPAASGGFIERDTVELSDNSVKYIQRISADMDNNTTSSIEDKTEYILSEPIETDITATSAGQALLSLHTEYPNTTVICGGDCKLEYKADTTIAYNNLLQRVAAIESAAVNNI